MLCSDAGLLLFFLALLSARTSPSARPTRRLQICPAGLYIKLERGLVGTWLAETLFKPEIEDHNEDVTFNTLFMGSRQDTQNHRRDSTHAQLLLARS